MRRRVIVDGVEYESARAASEALGVPYATAVLRAKGQRGGWRYADDEPVADSPPFRPTPRRPVRVHGVDYPSTSAAARALGLGRVVLERRIAQRWDGYEEGEGAEAPPRKCVQGKPRPFTLGGVVYPSRSAAAAALGVSREEIARRLAEEWRAARNRHKRPVWVDGVRYESITAASKAFGVAPYAIVFRIVRGWPGWSWGPAGHGIGDRLTAPETSARV